MKKLLVGISSAAVIGIGSLFVVSGMEEESKEERVETSAAETTETEEPKDEPKEEVVEIPSVRTVDTGPNHPWEHFTSERISELQENGETVYLFDDATALEEHVIEMANVEIPDHAPTTKEEAANSTANHLKQFIEGVQPFVDKPEYFSKLEEVQNALLNGQYDSVPTLIQEAKTLRESE